MKLNYAGVDLNKLVKVVTPFLDLDYTVNQDRFSEYMQKFKKQESILDTGTADLLPYEVVQMESQMRLKHEMVQLAKKRKK